jgi:hypothetical protein
MHLRRPSPGTILAIAALFFAISGTAIAAKHYLIVSTGQIKPSVLRKLKGNIGKEGPAGKEGAVGKEGPAGKEGAVGKEGPAGPTTVATLKMTSGGLVETVERRAGIIKLYIAESVAKCPAGTHAISGGSTVEEPDKADKESSYATEENGVLTGWEVYVEYTEKVGRVEAIAYCATAGDAVQASKPLAGSAQRPAITGTR